MKGDLFMKKKFMLTLLIICVYCVLLISCNGDSSKADVDLGSSRLFTQEELEGAVSCIKREFRGFNGCTMLNLRYDEEETKKAGPQWAKDAERKGRVAIFLSDFETGSSGGDGSMEPNSKYPDWQWIVIKDKTTGEWQVLTSGYC